MGYNFSLRVFRPLHLCSHSVSYAVHRFVSHRITSVRANTLGPPRLRHHQTFPCRRHARSRSRSHGALDVLHLGERNGVQVRARITAPPALVCAGEGFGATHAQCSSDNGEMYRLYCRRAWCVVLKSHECWWDAAIPWTALSGASYGWPSFARPNVNHSMSNTISTAGIGCTCVTASVTVAWRRLGYYMLVKIRPRSTIRISGCDPEAP